MTDLEALKEELLADELPQDRQYQREARLVLRGLRQRSFTAIKRLEAENAKLRGALMQGLEFVEHHSSRWDGRAGPHPNDIVSAARAALKG